MISSRAFQFGLEIELLLVDASSYRPLWHRDLMFEQLNAALEEIPIGDLVSLEGLKLDPPHKKVMPFVVEGYHVPDPDMNPIDLLPKGVEIRTPVCDSIAECIRSLAELHDRLQTCLLKRGYRAVAVSFHPFETSFEGPQNKRRYDHWQWAMKAMLTYGPDVNVGVPRDVFEQLDLRDLHAKVNHYAPALIALTVASPICGGNLWRMRGRVGKSVRTYTRSVVAPAIEVHPGESARLEFKALETSHRLEDYRGYFLLWLELLLDEELRGRASHETRIYDLGAVARAGIGAECVTERAAELFDRAPAVLEPLGFDVSSLEPFRARLASGRVPADDIITLYETESASIPDLLRHFVLH